MFQLVPQSETTTTAVIGTLEQNVCDEKWNGDITQKPGASIPEHKKAVKIDAMKFVEVYDHKKIFPKHFVIDACHV